MPQDHSEANGVAEAARRIESHNAYELEKWAADAAGERSFVYFYHPKSDTEAKKQCALFLCGEFKLTLENFRASRAIALRDRTGRQLFPPTHANA